MRNVFLFSQCADIRIHEEYAVDQLSNDIALLKLEKPFEFSKDKGTIASVRLPRENEPIEGDVVVSGFGEVPGRPRLRLQAVTLTVLPTHLCGGTQKLYCTLVSASRKEGICEVRL